MWEIIITKMYIEKKEAMKRENKLKRTYADDRNHFIIVIQH